ncbi:MAG TPA: hypothetical protein VFR02_07270, partial [bacterium]|nr:hypothetical protein [bacterium]
MTQAVSQRVTLEDHQECLRLFGEKDHTLKLLREAFALTLIARGNELLLSGGALEVAQASQTIERLRSHLRHHHEGYLSAAKVSQAIAEAKGEAAPEPEPTGRETILVSSRKKPISARTDNQQKYV